MSLSNIGSFTICHCHTSCYTQSFIWVTCNLGSVYFCLFHWSSHFKLRFLHISIRGIPSSFTNFAIWEHHTYTVQCVQEAKLTTLPCYNNKSHVRYQSKILPEIFSPSFQSRTSQTRLSCGTNQIGLVHTPAPHKNFVLYQHIYTQSEHPHSQTHQANSSHYQSVTMTAFRIPLYENCALLRCYVSSGNSLTFWGQLIGPISKGINSLPSTYRDNLQAPFSREKILDPSRFRTTYQSHLLTLEDETDRLSQKDRN